MKRLSWAGLAGALALCGCVSQVEREAMSFPEMPSMAYYQRVDATPVSPDQASDALLAALGTCRKESEAGATAPAGSPAFDACMARQGYRRVR